MLLKNSVFIRVILGLLIFCWATLRSNAIFGGITSGFDGLVVEILSCRRIYPVSRWTLGTKFRQAPEILSGGCQQEFVIGTG